MNPPTRTAFSRLATLLALCLPLAWAAPALALRDEVLWLPALYQQQLAPRLRQAALALEATERCERLLRGSLHDSSTGVEDAVFQLLCRDPQGISFAVLVDAATLQATYPTGSPDAVAEAPAAALPQARLLEVEESCGLLFERETRFMNDLQRLPAAATEVDAGTVRVRIPFDAASPQGARLHYEALCEAADGEAAGLVIQPRRDVGGLP